MCGMVFKVVNYAAGNMLKMGWSMWEYMRIYRINKGRYEGERKCIVRTAGMR